MSSFWSLFRPAAAPAPAARRFTLEELRSLWAVLAANPVVTESNRQLVVESLRSVAEFIIWGDQHEGRIFDFFLEHNVMTYLHSVLLQPSNRRGEVAKQVLQTLSIIIQNVRSETASFFLFSNNHINNIVDLDFDWDDEEVLGYYVSFLKTISLRLNAGTVQFFIQTAPPAPAPAFPLYTRALALAHNREGMVRAAVRTLTLHVYSVDDPAIAAFVTSPPAASYFGDVAAYLAKHVALLDKRLAAAEGGGSMALGSLDSQLAEVEDVLSYVSDLLSLGVPSIAQLLASSIWQCVVWPQLLRPLLEPAAAAQAAAAAAAAAAGRPSRGNNSSSSRGLAGSPGSSFRQPGSNAGSPGYGRQLGDAGGGGGSRQQAATCVRPVCAVFVLERLFQLLMYAPLLQQLLLALMCSSSSNSGGSGTSGGGCRAGLLAMLTGGDPYAAVMVLRLLVAALNNRHISAELLAALAVLPRKRQQQGAAQQQQQLGELAALVEGLVAQLQALREGDVDAAAQQQGQGGGRDASSALGGGQASSSMAGAAAAGGTRSSSGELLHLLTQQYLPAQLQALAQQCSHTQQGREGAGTAAGAAAAGAAGDAGTGAAGAAGAARLCRGKHSHSSSLGELEDLLVMQPQQDSGPAAAAAAGAAGAGAAFNSVGPQLLAALLQLLQAEGLPAMGLWLAGWLLHQLLPAAEAAAGGGAVVAPQRPTTPPDGAAEAASSRRHSRASSSSCSSSSSELSGEDDGSIVDTCGYTSRASSSVSTAAASMDGAALPPYLHAEQGASLLSPQQQLLLQAAVNAARAEFARQLSGMWCEAVFPMLSSEWPRAREMMQRPVLRAGSEAVLSGTAVWPLLVGVQQQQQQQAPQQQQQQQGLAVAARGTAMDALSASARAGLSCYFAVQRVVAMTQLQELLSCGAISHEPPAPTVSDAELKQMDVQEGYQVDLAPGSALPCVVSFAPGQERRVLFAVAGLSCQQLAGAQHDASAAAQQPAGRAALLSSLPVAVLADPSPSRPNAGVVLSVAPLLGARPYCDQGVPKWLHVHVRPSVRGLQRVVRTAAANKGGLLSAMRQLADGHWVLAFSSADKAAAAVSLAQQHTERLQRLYRDALAVLCPLMPPAAAQQEQVLEQPPQCREQQLQQQPPDHRQQDLEHVSEPQECLQEQQQVVGADACPAGASHEAAAEQPTDLAAAADKAAATGQALGAAVALAAEAGG